MTPAQSLITELQAVNARLVSLLASRPTGSPESVPGLANEYAENMELVHIYRTHGLAVWRAAHKEVMARRKVRMALAERQVA